MVKNVICQMTFYFHVGLIYTCVNGTGNATVGLKRDGRVAVSRI